MLSHFPPEKRLENKRRIYNKGLLVVQVLNKQNLGWGADEDFRKRSGQDQEDLR